MTFDVVVVGSGPSGAQAAKEAAEAGLDVAMLDVGFDDPDLAASIPRGSFAELRRTDPEQRRYFLGFEGETDADVNDRVGGHFTPPRSYIKRGVRELAPVSSDSFFPEMSLALGGLGAGWGSGAQVFEDFELERAGLPVEAMRECYDEVASDIGVSGSLEDDTAATSVPRCVQSPSAIDTNALAIMARYGRRRSAMHARNFLLGRAPLAMLTETMHRGTRWERGANPYEDMDFYGESARSIYRPKYTIEELRANPRFRYIGNALVERFEDGADGTIACYRDVRDGSEGSLSARRILLAANPINTARIALRSARAIGARQPLLCNPYHYVVTANLAMLGRPASDRRHSLAQLVGSLTPAHRGEEHVFAAFFSYRSLMHFRLVREMPLSPGAGLLLSRALMNALTIVGVHHPESPTDRKWVRLATDGIIEASYALGSDEEAAIAGDLHELRRVLMDLRCIPLSTIATPPGSSIHYAGTIPISRGDGDPALTTAPDGRLSGSPNVYVADSSGWRYLPAKGPTLTMMANARRVAKAAIATLR